MKQTKPEGTLPLLPLRDMVVYPRVVAKIYIGRSQTIAAIQRAIDTDNLVFVCTQKQASINEPTLKDLYAIGCVAKIIRVHPLPDGTVQVALQGTEKGQLIELGSKQNYLEGKYAVVGSSFTQSDEKTLELRKLLVVKAHEYAQLRPQKDKLLGGINSAINEFHQLFDFIVNMLPLSLEEKYRLFAEQEANDAIARLIGHLDGHLELNKIDERLQKRVRSQISRNQREYYINEQIKALQNELVAGEDGKKDPIQDYARRIKDARMSPDANAKATEELAKLGSMSPMSAESSVIRNYLDVLIALPWRKRTQPNYDIHRARAILDEHHYGLTEVKERIIEYIAAYKRSKGKVKAPILCLVGPPGVGKTSLARSIATATNRKFVRMALGGVRDESEIRGHRRTYIGSMPGRIVQKMSKCGVVNPLFLFDEIDKMGMDFRGDPASALLEVLDPEQNTKFNDHYVEVDYSLSKVLFLCTSNSMNIPDALLDRLEIIRIAGYTEQEKLHIAENYLISRQLVDHNCTANEITIKQSALHEIIHHYTREAGVRAFEREIAKIIRKAVLQLEEHQSITTTKNRKSRSVKKQSTQVKTIVVDQHNLAEFIGIRRFEDQELSHQNRLGAVNGLAWTKFGGHLLTVETAVFTGKGNFVITGSLGDVMKESVQAALSVCRSRSHWLNLPSDFFAKHDFHVHIPEGATPKDGPSAGVTICLALFSLLSGLHPKSGIAMTGELTINGSVLQIGGLKEKLLAAHRAGIHTVFIPAINEKDLKEVPQDVLDAVHIVKISSVDQLFTEALDGFDNHWLKKPQPFIYQQLKSSDIANHNTH